jgi:hypothetical protein
MMMMDDDDGNCGKPKFGGMHRGGAAVTSKEYFVLI